MGDGSNLTKIYMSVRRTETARMENTLMDQLISKYAFKCNTNKKAASVFIELCIHYIFKMLFDHFNNEFKNNLI